MYPIPTSSLNEIVSAALVKYTKLTGKDLVNDPLTVKVTPDTIYPVLWQHADLETFHDHSKLMICLEAIVGYFQALSTTSALNEVVSLQVVSPRVCVTSITTLRRFLL